VEGCGLERDEGEGVKSIEEYTHEAIEVAKEYAEVEAAVNLEATSSLES